MSNPTQLRAVSEKRMEAGDDRVALLLREAADHIDRLTKLLNPPPPKVETIFTSMCVGGPYDGMRYPGHRTEERFVININQEDMPEGVSASAGPDTVAYKQYVYTKEFLSFKLPTGNVAKVGYWKWSEHSIYGSFEWLFKRFGDLTMLEERIVNAIGKDAVYADFHHLIPSRK